MIMFDGSKEFSEIYGDRFPNDPWYRVRFMQDGLPFDSEKRLIPDDGNNVPVIITVEGKPTSFPPLYDDKRRELLKRRLERLAKHLPEEPDPAMAAAAAKAEQELEINDVNLEQWLLGKESYEFHLVVDAVKKRYSVHKVSKAAIVDYLVNEQEIVSEKDLPPGMKKALDKNAAAA